MPRTYRVQQGDYLTKIAAENGFSDMMTIWNHPANAQLKQKRKNPHCLHPDDVLVIPDLQKKEVGKSTTQVHNFEVPTSTVNLALRLVDMNFEAIPSATCALELGGQTQGNRIETLTTGGQGEIDHDILVRGGHVGVLTVQVPEWPYQIRMGLKIGHLDPITELSGQIARLNNLGYFAGPIAEEPTDRFKSAVEEFQCDHELAVDGIIGPQTQAKLKEIHGC